MLFHGTKCTYSTHPAAAAGAWPLVAAAASAGGRPRVLTACLYHAEHVKWFEVVSARKDDE